MNSSVSTARPSALPEAGDARRPSSPPPLPASAPSLPRIAVLATGGTIAGLASDATRTAGYQAGALGIGPLLDAVPGLAARARIEAAQIASIDSKDMTPALWTLLVRRVNALLARADIDGIVITHGTDTLEETAWLLHLTVPSAKPVVLTAAMRPASALSADGPLNLLNAVTVAASARARGQGVLVAFNNRIHCARDVVKVSTCALDAFQSPEVGALGWVQDGRVEFQRRATRAHTVTSAFAAGPLSGAARGAPLHEAPDEAARGFAHGSPDRAPDETARQSLDASLRATTPESAYGTRHEASHRASRALLRGTSAGEFADGLLRKSLHELLYGSPEGTADESAHGSLRGALRESLYGAAGESAHEPLPETSHEPSHEPPKRSAGESVHAPLREALRGSSHEALYGAAGEPAHAPLPETSREPSHEALYGAASESAHEPLPKSLPGPSHDPLHGPADESSGEPVFESASGPSFAWPQVEIVASYAGVSRIALDALVAAGVRGIVVAGTGNGSIHAGLQQALAEAAARGVCVVRASRVGSGHVMRNGAAPDDALGFVSAGTLNPYKARVLLMLALAAGIADARALQQVFDTY